MICLLCWAVVMVSCRNRGVPVWAALVVIVIRMSEEQEQQIIEKYLFIIRPLEIKSSSRVKSSSRKSILIKLGNKTAKCSDLNTSVELEIEVLYSKTLQKYCPVKGIIKIYDVSEDGAEIISCVGGFQTDELLNQGKPKVVIDKEIGTSKLTMEVQIVSRNHSKPLLENQESKAKDVKRKTLNDNKQGTESSPKNELQKGQKTALCSQSGTQSSSNLEKSTAKRVTSPLLKLDTHKNYQIPFKNTSNSINKSLEKINQALSFKRFEQSTITSRANEVLAKAQVQSLKQQLQEEKRRGAALEDRLSRSDQKLSAAKVQLGYFSVESQQYREIFSRVLETVSIKEGAVVGKLDPLSQYYSVKYTSTEVEKVLPDLLHFIHRKVQEQLPSLDLDHESIEASRIKHEIEQNKKELIILKKLATEKDKKIVSLQRQIEGAEVTIRNLKQTNRHLTQENKYFRQKNDQLQITLYHKENSIDSLNHQNQQLTEEVQKIENKLYNSGLEIEELKEQVSNCMETIEKYRVKYGDLKNVKNRAIEMEIKECLRWIELQNRDLQMSEIEETTPSEHQQSQDRGDTLSSVIRSIEIEKVPKEEMTIIRDELLKILQKVDEMMAK